MYVLMNLWKHFHRVDSEQWKVKSLSRVWLFETPWTVCSLPGSSVHGIFQARVLEWVAISFSRGSSRPRDQTQVYSHCTQTVYCLSHKGSGTAELKGTCPLNLQAICLIIFPKRALSLQCIWEPVSFPMPLSALDVIKLLKFPLC